MLMRLRLCWWLQAMLLVSFGVWWEWWKHQLHILSDCKERIEADGEKVVLVQLEVVPEHQQSQRFSSAFFCTPPPLPPLLTSMDSSEHFTQCPDLWATTQLSVFCTVAGLVVATHSYCEHLFSLFNWQTRQCWDQNHNLEKQKKCNCSHMKWKKHTKIVPKRWPFHGAYHCYTNYENKKNNEEKTQHLAEPVTTHVRGREHNSICFMFFSLYLVH